MDYSLIVGILPMSPEEVAIERKSPKQNKSSSPLNSFETSSAGGFPGTYKDGSRFPEDYFLGIIDVLQPYNIRKKVENVIRRVKDDEEVISCVDPATYSSRFLQFMM